MLDARTNGCATTANWRASQDGEQFFVEGILTVVPG
jgi:hypothetical protein